MKKWPKAKKVNVHFVRFYTAEELSPEELALFKFCPTTSTDVEKSFSIYIFTLNDKRRRFLFENIKQHMIVQCNVE